MSYFKLIHAVFAPRDSTNVARARGGAGGLLRLARDRTMVTRGRPTSRGRG